MLFENKKIKVNTVPLTMLNILGQKYYGKNWRFNADLSCINCEYPQNVIVKQDKGSHVYFENFKATLFNSEAKDQNETANRLKWQLIQCYRIINAAYDSKALRKEDVTYKTLYEVFYVELKQLNVFANALKELKQKPGRKDIAIIAHCESRLSDGFISFEKSNVELHIYNGPGSELDFNVGYLIDNGRYQKNKVYVIDDLFDTAFVPNNIYPKIFKNNTLEVLPNLRVADEEDLSPRVVVIATGEIIEKIPDGTKLSDLLERYENYKIHLSSCMILKKNCKNIGPEANLAWVAFESKSEKEEIKKEFRIFRSNHPERFTQLKSTRPHFFFKKKPTLNTNEASYLKSLTAAKY